MYVSIPYATGHGYGMGEGCRIIPFAVVKDLLGVEVEAGS